MIRTEFLKPKITEMELLDDHVASIEGTVLSVKIKSYYAAITVKLKNEKVLLQVNGDFLNDKNLQIKIYDLVGRRITARGDVSLPNGRRNPGDSDYKQYLLSKNVHTIVKATIYKVSGKEIKLHFINLLSNVKGKFYAAISPYLANDSFSLLAGVMFGETSYLDEDIYSEFKETGIAHILAVSGLHVGLMYDLISKVFKKKNLTSDLLSLSVIFIYMALSNFSVSVIRASLMIVLKIVAKYCQRRYDSVSAASFVCIVFLLINPYKLYDSGMQLSFCSVYSMGIIAPWLKIKISKFADKNESETSYKIGEILSPSLAAIIGTAPISAYQFFMFSPISLILNPLIIALAGIFLPICLISFCIFIILPTTISRIILMALAYTIDGFSSLLLGIAKISSDINFIKITTAPPLGALILYYLMVFFFFSETRYLLHRKNKLFELSIIETFLILIGTAGPYFLKFTNSINPFDYGVATVTFLDVGQGDCIHIHKGSLDILIDGGGNYYSNIGEKTLKPYFQRNGIKDIDLAIITHNDIDHAKGINELNEIFTIKSIVDNKKIYGNSLKNENDNCIVSGLEIEGLKFLFMADADIKRENYLLDNGKIGDCDILKVGHHGSATSTGERLIKETAPSFAVISVGENNNYGHPTARVLDLLEMNAIEYARTDIYGAICLRKVTDEYYIFENARKDKTWKLFKKVQ